MPDVAACAITAIAYPLTVWKGRPIVPDVIELGVAIGPVACCRVSIRHSLDLPRRRCACCSSRRLADVSVQAACIDLYQDRRLGARPVFRDLPVAFWQIRAAFPAPILPLFS